MTDTEKLNIAQQLSKEYGMEGRKRTEESHYDRTTGTLFVGSRVFNSEALDRARRFFQENKIRAIDKNDASCDFYEIAEVAVGKLMDDSLGQGGRIVIKESAGV